MRDLKFTFPEEVETGYGLPERVMLYSLAKLYQAHTVVELGVGAGYSTYWLCRGAEHVYGFDVWARHGQQGQFEQWSSKEEVTDRLHAQGVENFTLTQCNLFEADLPNIGVIDMAFIDGDHSYVGIKNDFEKVLPQLGDNGLIVFHDTLVIDGCREFILDLEKEYNLFTIPFGTLTRRVGITLCQRRESSGIPISEICGSPSLPEEIYRREEEIFGCRR